MEKKKKEKIYKTGAFVLTLVIVTAIIAIACFHGCSPLDLPTGLALTGALLLGFVLILVICHEKKQ
jgi:hypothetical protein